VAMALTRESQDERDAAAVVCMLTSVDRWL
jgi:hypothetical protein